VELFDAKWLHGTREILVHCLVRVRQGLDFDVYGLNYCFLKQHLGDN
jgi:hypothetical protein